METEDHFVSIGTALEPIEEDDAPKKKPVPIADQIVTDEKGRRRFHGAFTGGFSAGYFNTVGTKEGWTPSTFKSTRADRSSVKNQNVHDFMDDEDLGAFGIAPQLLRPTNEFEQESRKRGGPSEQSGPIPGTPVLEQLIQPVKDTIGVRILLRMGWRHGKGLGPLKSRKPQTTRKTTGDNYNRMPSIATASTEKVYGCSLEDFQEKDMESEDSEEEVLLLPDDNENVFCNPKENLFGLGYTGLNRNTLSFGGSNLFDRQLKFRVENKNMSIRGEAFGIGAFEDEDEEVYSREDASDYDFALETPDERKNRRTLEKGATKKKTSEKDVCVSGFVRAKSKSSSQRFRFYPPPVMPKNFVPMHSVKKSRFEPDEDVKVEETRKLGLDRHKLSAEERKILLNDATSRIHKQVVEKQQDPDEVRKKLAAERAERLLKFTSILERSQPSTSEAFKPFVNNPEKQDRYEKYMTLVAAGFQECLKDLQPLDMTEFEREREVQEFKRASSLYKPLAGVISSRFVSAKSHDISNQAPTKEVQKEKLATEDPYVAAKMNLFGKLTHEILEWHPDRLLCKRFNVPHPYPDSKFVGVVGARVSDQPIHTATDSAAAVVPEPSKQDPKKNEAPQQSITKKSLFDNIDFSKPPPGLLPLPEVREEDAQNQGSTTSTSEAQAQEKEDSESTIVKPSKDLFKEIFADTSSESELDQEDDDVRVPDQKHEDIGRKIPTKHEAIVEEKADEPEDVYGPRIPTKLLTSGTTTGSRFAKYDAAKTVESKNEENLWVEKDSASRKTKAHKNKKSKSKHKERRHKPKSSKSRKKKKKDRRKSVTNRSRSDTDTSSDDDDGEDGDRDSDTRIKTKQLLSTLKTLVSAKQK